LVIYPSNSNQNLKTGLIPIHALDAFTYEPIHEYTSGIPPYNYQQQRNGIQKRNQW
jgi:hypothetical protein